VSTGRNRALRPFAALLLAVLVGLGLSGPSGSISHVGRSLLGEVGTATSVSARQALPIDADTVQRVASPAPVQLPSGPALPVDLTAALLLVVTAVFLGHGRRAHARRRSVLQVGTGPARAPPQAA
jgi:hypothetical protein